MPQPYMPATRFIHIQHTPVNPKTRPYITQHLVWDADLFVMSQIRQFDREAKPEDRHTISVATEADYRAQQKKVSQ